MKRQILLRVTGLSFVLVLSFNVGNAEAVIVGSWDFEEASGATVFDGVGNFDATIGAGTGSRVPSGDFAGALGQSWDSDSGAGGASVNTAAYAGEYNALTSASFESWIKWDGTGVTARWFSINSPYLALIHTGVPGVRFFADGLNSGYMDISLVPVNQWVQFVTTYDGGTGTMKVYANAAEVFSAGGGTGLDWAVSDTNDWTLGLNNMDGANDRLSGLVDHLSIHDVALTPAEVQARYDLIAAITANTDFDGMNGTDIADFHILRGNYLLTGMTQPQGDANFDSIVNHEDFYLWRTAVAGSGGSLADINWAAVPEPSALVLLVSCGLVFLSCGRTPRQLRK